MSSQKRILVVCSGSGHWDEAAVLLPAFEGQHVRVALFNRPGSEHFAHPLVSRFHRLTHWGERIGPRLLISLCINFIQFLWIFARFRPNVLFSTGAELVIPAIVVSRIFPNVKRIFLEVSNRAESLSLSAKLIRPFCDHFWVQWPDLATRVGGKTEYKGRVF